jgi:hypothetical protein
MSQLQYAFGSFDPAKGIGAGRAAVPNPAFDNILNEASVTLDKPARDKLLGHAADIAIGQDVAVIPLYFVRAGWAMRSGLRYEESHRCLAGTPGKIPLLSWAPGTSAGYGRLVCCKEFPSGDEAANEAWAVNALSWLSRCRMAPSGRAI